MNKVLTLCCAMVTMALVAACATTDYVGRRYAPTMGVDVYFSLAEVKRQYEVMGIAQTRGDQSMEAQSIQEQLEKDAMAAGADAIVIEGMEVVETGSTSSNNGQAVDATRPIRNGREAKPAVRWDQQTTTTIQREKVIKAKLLKYKN